MSLKNSITRRINTIVAFMVNLKKQEILFSTVKAFNVILQILIPVDLVFDIPAKMILDSMRLNCSGLVSKLNWWIPHCAPLYRDNFSHLSYKKQVLCFKLDDLHKILASFQEYWNQHLGNFDFSRISDFSAFVIPHN